MATLTIDILMYECEGCVLFIFGFYFTLIPHIEYVCYKLATNEWVCEWEGCVFAPHSPILHCLHRLFRRNILFVSYAFFPSVIGSQVLLHLSSKTCCKSFSLDFTSLVINELETGGKPCQLRRIG